MGNTINLLDICSALHVLLDSNRSSWQHVVLDDHDNYEKEWNWNGAPHDIGGAVHASEHGNEAEGPYDEGG